MEASSSFRVHQSPPLARTPSRQTVTEVETLLEEWFGVPVVLMSSGRGATLVALNQFGLNRYNHQVALPRMITACVVTSVARYAFPVDAAAGAKVDATVLYHQYGYPQTIRPPGLVLEDICHAFFVTPDTGRRDWAGAAAVFSLPKFMPTASMVGGLAVPERSRAMELRRLRDAVPPRTEAEIAWDMQTFVGCYHDRRGALEMEEMCLSRLLNPQINDRELGAIPSTMADLQAIGRRRREVVDELIDAVGATALPSGWSDIFRASLPFQFPIGGEPEALQRLTRTLREAGFEADIYSIDLNRNMASPRLARMLLVPCHDCMPQDAKRDLLSILRSHRLSP